MLGREASVQLIIGILFNQSIPSGRAFAAPGELLARLGCDRFDLALLEDDYDAVQVAIARKPALHRFPAKMARHVHRMAIALRGDYASDPRNIWRGAREDEILHRLMALDGIGRHKAVQLLICLSALGETGEVSGGHLRYMAENCEGFFRNLERDVAAIAAMDG